MKEILHVLHGNDLAGTLIYDRSKDALSLEYEDGWRFSGNAFPLSMSIPLVKKCLEKVGERSGFREWMGHRICRNNGGKIPRFSGFRLCGNCENP